MNSITYPLLQWIAGLAIGFVFVLSMALWYMSGSYNKLQTDYNTLQAEYKVLDVQKAALISAVDIQNVKIKEYEMNEQKNLLSYSKALEKNAESLNQQLKISRQLKTEKEICDYMVRKSYEILNK